MSCVDAETMTQSPAPYGSWKSPITADLIVSDTVGFGQIVLDGEDVYWSEMRPTEGGRNVIVRRNREGHTEDVLPAPFNARTRVHEYGGGAFTVCDGVIWFSNFSDQRVYRLVPDDAPVAITPEGGQRYADGVIDRRRRRLICVREDHASGNHPVNAIVSLDLNGRRETQVLAAGHDFYASPRLSPDGSQLAWIAWDHPNMPWDGTELWRAEVMEDGTLGKAVRLAGGKEESIFQPVFSPEGILYFVSDRSGWWNLYRRHNGKVESLVTMEAEFGLPQWVFGMSTYAFESENRIVCAYNQQGIWHLATVDTVRRELTPVDTPYTDIGSLCARPGQAVFLAAAPTQLPAVVQCDLATGRLDVLRRSATVCLEPGYLSKPRAIEYPSAGGETVHAFFYAPRNHDYEGETSEKPPLLVLSHGGPTSAASSALNLKIQYWTSRGFAVLDVNYRGSTGYGRAYRKKLEGAWGVADVEDCVNGAKYLAARGLVDAGRLAIRGGSAGGYSTLCALVFHDLFKVGASYYGVSDLEALAQDTHKFEAYYLDRLIGPYPAQRDRYRDRSPIHHTEGLTCPVIFFQGLEDKVVPPDQTQRMAAALRAKGIPVAYVPFEGEQHGFRRAENIKRALESELYFYGRILGFTPADPIEPAVIENL